MSYTTTAPAAPPAPGAKLKPSGAWYWVGGLLIFAGIAAAIGIIVAGVLSVWDTVAKFARFVAPTEGTSLTFEKSGTYTVYYEHNSKVSGERIESPDSDDFKDSIDFKLLDAD